MDDDYDIYGDLEGFEVETRKENQVVKELNAEIDELKAKIVEKETEKEVITKQNGILLENISSLLLTAKAEIKRKDSLISDIRRQRDDNAFRRNPRPVRKHDKGTQTTLIRLLSQSVQTESVGTMTEIKLNQNHGRDRNRRRSRSASRDDRRMSKNPRHKNRSPRKDLRDMIREKKNLRKALLIENRRERKATQFNIREKERERDRRARHHENRSPDLSPVEFPCLRRQSREEVTKADSVAEIKLKETFIPMNKSELDRYVKEMARSDKRSPDAVTLETVSNSDLWDAERKLPRMTSRENHANKHEHNKSNDRATTTVETATNSDPWDSYSEANRSKRIRRTSKLGVEEHIIQSDEIGTTGVGASLSPESMEDVEQKMRALHGESTPSTNVMPECIQTSTELIEGLNKSSGTLDTSQPPALVIPPQEPPIIELVPELSFEDDQRLNDSRELRIVESEDTAAEQDDERNSSAKTMTAKQPIEKKEDLEEGEVVSSDESQPAPADARRFQPTISARLQATTSIPKLQLTSQKTPTHHDRKARIVLDKLSDSVIRKHERSSHHRSPDGGKSSRHEAKAKSKSDRHSEHFETSTPNRTIRRRSQRLSDSHEAKVKSKSRLSEETVPVRADPVVNEKVHGKSKKESLKELFGTDDENSLFGTPEKVSTKRRNSGKRDKSDDRKKQKVGLEVPVADEKRAFKEIVSSKLPSMSESRDRIDVPADRIPRKEVRNSGFNVPIVASSEEVSTPISKDSAGLTQIEKHSPSETEAAAKTLSEVMTTSSTSNGRATSKSSLKPIMADVEQSSIHEDVLEIVRTKRRSKSKAHDKIAVPADSSPRKDASNSGLNAPIVVDSSSAASSPINEDTAGLAQVEQLPPTEPETATKTLPEVMTATSNKDRTTSKNSPKHVIPDEKQQSIHDDVLQIVRTKRRSKSKMRDKIDVPADSGSRKEAKNSGLNVPIVVDSSSEDTSTPIEKDTAELAQVEQHPPPELEAAAESHSETMTTSSTCKKQTTPNSSLKHTVADDEQPSIHENVLEIVLTKRRPKSKIRDKINVSADRVPRKEVKNSELNVPIVVEEASTPINKEPAGLTQIENLPPPEPVAAAKTLSEVIIADQPTSKISFKNTIADDEQPSVHEDVIEIVRTKRRSKSRARGKIGVPVDVHPTKTVSITGLNEPIVLDSSSEDGPTSSVLAKQTWEEKHQESEIEAATRTLPEVCDETSRCEVLRWTEFSADYEQPPLDLSVESRTVTCQKDESLNRVTESAITKGPAVQPSFDNVFQHTTDPQVRGDQTALQYSPSMEVSSSSAQTQDLLSEAHVAGNARSDAQLNEFSQEDQKHEQHPDSHPLQREIPQIGYETSVEPEQLSSTSFGRADNVPAEDQVEQEEVPLQSSQQPDTQTIVDQPLANSPQGHASPLAHGRTVFSEGTIETDVAVESQGDLHQVSSHVDCQVPIASSYQQAMDVPSSEPNHSITTTECTDVPACQPDESVLLPQTSLPENPHTDHRPETVAPSESPIPKPPQVIIYSDKYAEYRVEDNNEAEITIYVTRKKRRSRKSLQTSANLSTSGIVVE